MHIRAGRKLFRLRCFASLRPVSAANQPSLVRTCQVFEEILYRGFLLPTLVCYMPMHFAIPASSILFAAHHLNICGVLPLSVLGFVSEKARGTTLERS